jgi:hypothetical protein
MAEPVGRADPRKAEDPARDHDPFRGRRPATAAEIVPIGPNLIALIVGFGCLMAAPTVCLHLLEAVWEDAIGEDQVASLFILASWEETFAIAAVGAPLFLVIGIILQAWQARRPFASRWPAIVAFPIAWGLIVPETLIRGGSSLSGAVVASAVALVFSMQWGSVVVLRETMD